MISNHGGIIIAHYTFMINFTLPNVIFNFGLLILILQKGLHQESAKINIGHAKMKIIWERNRALQKGGGVISKPLLPQARYTMDPG